MKGTISANSSSSKKTTYQISLKFNTYSIPSPKTCLSITLMILLFLHFFSYNALADNTPTASLSLKAGAYENHPKIYTDNNGHIVGLFPDILNYIAKKEGWKLEYIKGSWNQCLDRLKNNQIDIMVDVAFSEERAKEYLFSDETCLVSWATVYTSKNQSIDSLIDLNDKKIAVMKNSIHTEGKEGIKKLATKFDINCSFIEVDTYKDVFDLLSKDEADAGVVNRIFGSLFSETYGVKETSIIFNPRQVKFAFPKKSPLAPILKKTIDRHLNNLKKDPNSIYNKALYVYLSGLPRKLIFTQNAPQKTEIYLTNAEKMWIKKHPKIHLGVDPEFAPFEYFSSKGIYRGIASEYIKILNQRLGVNMQVVHGLSWKEAITKAKAKEIDVLPCVGITQERKKYFNFSKPYIDFHRVIITRTNTPFLTGIDDITHLKVAVQENTSHQGYLRENTTITPILYKTLQESLLAVSNGRVDAFVGNIASCSYWIRKLNLTNLKIAAPVSQETQTLHFAVRNDWPELITILNKGIDSITQKEKRLIRRQWVNIEYKPGIAPRLVLQYIIQIIAISLIILLIILFWNHRLKKEIQKRIKIDKQLSEANKNLKKLDRLKSMFIASMSHELRTPLNSIIGFTGVLLQGMVGPLSVKQTDHLKRVYDSAKHLLSLITDVIDISKIEAGKIDILIEDITLSEVINEAISNVSPLLKTKNLKINVSIPKDLQIRTEKKRLLQCIINYISNAIKYSETGEITVTAKTKNEKVEILVSDTGIGISEKDLSKLFKAFERLDSHLKISAGGTGLGLYLTRKLITEILQGEVIVRSKLGKGSTFGLLIPKMLHETRNITEE